MSLTTELFCLGDTVWVYEPSRLLHCRLCGAMVPPGGIESRFWQKHRLVGEPLQRVLAYAASVRPLNDPATLDLLLDGSAAIEGIAIYAGYCCNCCEYWAINKHNMLAHRGRSGYFAGGRDD